MDEMRSAIREFVRREYLDEDDTREITGTTPLITSGLVDSFSMGSLRRFVERKFQIQIPDAEATPAAFDTVDGIAALVERARQARG